jgi:cob(I)alamin adenosyltransferase
MALRAEEQDRLVHIYTGHSKGKTTASVGLAVRAVGAQWKVLYCSFFKPDGSSEHAVLERLGVDLRRFNWRGTFFRKYTPKEMEEQREDCKSFVEAVKAVWGEYDMVVMDEVVYAITSNVLDEQYFIDFIKEKPSRTELVLTGRDFPGKVLECAHYITEMKPIKHPFDEGYLPRKGVEF